jgi:F-type H+-transporting ATPase subunit a
MLFNLTEVGQHFYWSIFSYQVHGQVLINSWIVIFIIFALSLLTTRNLNLVPEDGQSFIEFVTEFIRDIAKTQIGEKEYLNWVPYLGTMFLFIFVSNWSGALIPWKILELPNGELASPTNDMCELNLIYSLNLLLYIVKQVFLRIFKNYFLCLY